jgi:hypothetical protein
MAQFHVIIGKRLFIQKNKGKHMATTSEELHAVVDQLSPTDQRLVMEFIRKLQEEEETHQRLLALPKSKLPEAKIPASALLGFKIPDERLDEIEQALQDCERIDVDEWKLFD